MLVHVHLVLECFLDCLYIVSLLHVHVCGCVACSCLLFNNVTLFLKLKFWFLCLHDTNDICAINIVLH